MTCDNTLIEFGMGTILILVTHIKSRFQNSPVKLIPVKTLAESRTQI